MNSVRTRALPILAVVFAFVFALTATAAWGQITRPITFQTTLIPLEEVPSILLGGTGRFEATLNGNGSISYRLTYSGLTSPVLFAHIHLAQRPVNGAIVIFLCGGGTKPACPGPTSGAVSGTITAADVMSVPAQNVPAGDLTDVIRAMVEGYTYVNVHTMKFPAGETRGYIPAQVR
jgi:hypothetical protein